MQTITRPSKPSAPARAARREITAFLLLTAALAVASSAGAAALGADMRRLDDASPGAQTLLFGAACIPVVAAVLARWLTGQRVRGAAWGWRTCTRAWLARAWIAPIVYAGAAAASIWLVGLGDIDRSSASVPAAMLAVTVGLVPFVALSLGEDLAWRGSFTAAVASLTSPFRTALFVGVVWSLFHWPLMLLVPGAIDGAPAAWGVACFTVSVTAISFPLHRLWQRTASIWPIVVFHATHNAVLYLVAEPFTSERGSTAWFSGETGLALVVTSVVVSAWLWRRWAPLPTGAPDRA